MSKIGCESPGFSESLGARLAVTRGAVGIVVILWLAVLLPLAVAGEEFGLEPASGLIVPSEIVDGGDASTLVVHGSDLSVWFGPAAITFRKTDGERAHAVRMIPLGADASVRPRGEDPRAAVRRFTKDGTKSGQACRRVVYEDLWPGIDLVYRTEVGVLKYDLVIDPGADPRLVRFAYEGSTAVSLDDTGALRVGTSVGDLVDDAPVAFVDSDNGEHVDVDVAFRVEKAPGRAPIVSFDVGAYDASRSLVIDPALSLYCGYVGGSLGDGAFGTADADGNAYIAGSTASSDLPVVGGPSSTFGGYTDVMVGKLDPAGNVIWLGYFGGAESDAPAGIDLDADGNLYIAGSTRSTQATLPVTVGPDLTYNGGTNDAFVAKISADGSQVLYCGYIGGVVIDHAFGVAVDTSGSAYVTGTTNSNAASFPLRVGPSLQMRASSDVFVAKVDPSGSSLVYCGYVGGLTAERVFGIDVDGLGRAYVVGEVSGPAAGFPVTRGPDLTYNGGPYDCFIARVAADGAALDYCGYVGGAGSEITGRVFVDSSNRAWVCGTTTSDETTFPLAVGPDLTLDGGSATFLTCVAADGLSIERSGYIEGVVFPRGLALDPFGRAWLTGYSVSPQDEFPLRHGPDATYNGDNDVWIARVNGAGTAVEMAGYFGGTGHEGPNSLAIAGDESVVVFGSTESTEATFPVNAGPDLTFGGITDGFVAKFRLEPPCVEGTVNLGAASLPSDVLFVNGSPGAPWRDVEASTGEPIYVAMLPAPAGPAPGPFALYARVAEPSFAAVAPVPAGIGDLCFAIPWTGGQPDFVWNNIGKPAKLGAAMAPSVPAPSFPLLLVQGLSMPLTVTFQGILLDDASAAQAPASVTNAVVLRVQ